MNIFNNVKQEIISILGGMVKGGYLPDETSFSAVTAEPPRDTSHGDIATNAAMVIAKKAGKKPRDLAEEIAKKLNEIDCVENVEIAGPGFINIRLKNEIWLNALLDILSEGKNYGNSNLGKNEKINVEYVSANPTGPMHIGHARGAVYGDALALLLQKSGYDVTKEYYINDAGSQIDVLARSAFLRYKEALGEDIGEIPQGLYPGDYLKPVGKALAEKFGNDFLNKEESDWLPIIRQFAVLQMMEMIRNDLKDLGIEHDVFSSEKDIQERGDIEKSLDFMQEKGLLYQGVLEPPKGKKPDNWSMREQTLFKATDYGDDVDRALKKSDGTYTYFASDIAYHKDKIDRGFNNIILILGADHGGYVKRMKAAVSALSDKSAAIDMKIAQLVNFLDDGKPVKMSKRAGTFTTVKDVIDEVGKDIIRFIMLTRKNDAVLDFDLKAVKEKSKDNPIFYVQYANARANSVLRNAQNECPKACEILKNDIDLNALSHIKSKDEIDLIKFMASWPRFVESATATHEPHRIAFYLQELAAGFHSLWNKGKDDAVMRFIIAENPELTAARLAMLKSVTNIIASGLAIFNIEPVKEM